MNATKQTRELKLQHWAEVIHECKNSGMSARQWMQENGIHKHQFYYWQRQLRAKALQTISNDSSSQPVHPLVEISQSSGSYGQGMVDISMREVYGLDPRLAQ